MPEQALATSAQKPETVQNAPMFVSTTDPPNGYAYTDSEVRWATWCLELDRRVITWSDSVNSAVTQAIQLLTRQAEANNWTAVFRLRVEVLPAATSEWWVSSTAGFCATVSGLCTR